MWIGELSKRAGVSIRSLRYYEEQNLLHPARLSSGYWVYDEADVRLVQRVQALLAAGLSTSKIEHILPCIAQHNDGLALTCSDLYSELVAEREGMLARINTLRISVEALNMVLDASPKPVTTLTCGFDSHADVRP